MWIFLIIVVLVFACFVVYDKRSVILSKLKTPKIKEKKQKTVKEKPEKQSDKVEVQNESSVEEPKQEDPYKFDNFPQQSPIQEEDFGQDFYEDNIEEEEAFDIDKILEEIKMEEMQSKKNFDDLSMSDLDDVLEDTFDDARLSRNSLSALNDYGYNEEISGEELGQMLRNLPKPIKILLLSDILKRKF